MTQQLDLIGICLDEASIGRIGLPQARDVRRPRLANAIAGEAGKPAHRQRGVVAPPLIDVPRAANADPDTSHEAAARIKASGALGKQQQAVLSMVRKFPGCTSAELAHAAAMAIGDDYARLRAMYGRRLADLKGVHARQGEARMCRITQARCVTWWPV